MKKFHRCFHGEKDGKGGESMCAKEREDERGGREVSGRREEEDTTG